MKGEGRRKQYGADKMADGRVTPSLVPTPAGYKMTWNLEPRQSASSDRTRLEPLPDHDHNQMPWWTPARPSRAPAPSPVDVPGEPSMALANHDVPQPLTAMSWSALDVPRRRGPCDALQVRVSALSPMTRP